MAKALFKKLGEGGNGLKDFIQAATHQMMINPSSASVSREEELDVPFIRRQVRTPEPSISNADENNEASALVKDNETSTYVNVVQNMRRLEAEKYPASHYTYQRKKVLIDGIKKDLVYVTYDGKPITNDELATIRSKSLAVRAHSIASGILYAMSFSENFLTSDAKERKEIESIITKLLGKYSQMNIDKNKNSDRSMNSRLHKKFEISKEENPNNQLCLFVDELVDEIKKATGNKLTQDYIVRSIRNSERYFVAKYRPDVIMNKTRINPNANDSTDKAIEVTQIDISYNNVLTFEQKIEFMRIHNEGEEPVWFRRLEDWEKKWIKQQIPDRINSERWAAFEKMNQSSAMSHIPGIQNVRMNLLGIQSDGQDFHLLSKNVKTGSWVPYQVPGKTRSNQSKHNAKQVLDNLKIESQSRFNGVWSFDKNDKPINWNENKKKKDLKPVVFVQSLLSDTVLGGADNQLAKEQMQAIRSLRKLYPDVEIIIGNDPVNILRAGSAESGLISTYIARRWTHTDKILNYSKEFLDRAITLTNGPDLVVFTPKQLDTLDLIRDLRKNLLVMRNDKTLPTFGRRNFSAFKVAYQQLLVESLGGITSTNCKSGKDRTGYIELYCAAMRIFREKYQRLPTIDDNEENRKKFIDIFVVLFNSMKAQEAAATNTPGSFGLKDTAMMLCPDIAEVLGLAYTNSNVLSDMNKPHASGSSERKNRPSDFKADEAREAKEIKRFHKENRGKPENKLQSESRKVHPELLSQDYRRRKTVIDRDAGTVTFDLPELETVSETNVRNSKLDDDIIPGIDIGGHSMERADDFELAEILEKSNQNQFAAFNGKRPSGANRDGNVIIGGNRKMVNTAVNKESPSENRLQKDVVDEINKIILLMERTHRKLSMYISQSGIPNKTRAISLSIEIETLKKTLLNATTSYYSGSSHDITEMELEKMGQFALVQYASHLEAHTRTRFVQVFSRNTEFDKILEKAKFSLANFNKPSNDAVNTLDGKHNEGKHEGKKVLRKNNYSFVNELKKKALTLKSNAGYKNPSPKRRG